MASEPSDRPSVSLPPDLDEWLTKHARELDVDEEEVLVQVLASYRTITELDTDLDAESLLDSEPDADVVEEMVRSIVRDRLDDIAAAVEERLDDGSELDSELDRVEQDFQTKLDDVRERVIQVKKEADGKASRDHDHEAFDGFEERLDDLESSLQVLRAGLEDRIEELEAELEAVERDDEGDPESVEERLDDVEQKLRTVAWVVSDLRDAHDTDSGTDETVAHLKRTAARENVDRAQCENCGNAVQVSLLTEPECPHCEAAVTEVVPSPGFFGRSRLSVAKQLEAGEEEPDRDVPDAARGR
jgi:chromosome segregation ATPase